MNKKYIYILIILLATITISSTSVSAFTIQKADKNTVYYSNGKSVITTTIMSNNYLSDYKMSNDLDKINKIIVKVDGKTVNTINKGKHWNRYKYYPLAIIDKKTVINDNVKGKKIAIYTFNDKNKLIKSKINIVNSITTYKILISKSQSVKLGMKALKDQGTSKNYMVTGKAKYYDGVWFVEVVDKQNKSLLSQVLINSTTGKALLKYGQDLE